MQQYKQLTLIILLIIAVGTIFYQRNTNTPSEVPSEIASETVSEAPPVAVIRAAQVFEAYDCDKLIKKVVDVPAGKEPIDVVPAYLPGPGSTSTVAEYSKSFKIENGVAYIDWPLEMKDLPNIDTSCALQAFLQPIDATLTQFDSIDTVVHSMGGSVGAFYLRMQLSCPEKNAECEAYFTQ